jgi:hypothetical protein
MNREALSSIMIEGRWAHAKSATGYIQEGRALQLRLRLKASKQAFHGGRVFWANLVRSMTLAKAAAAQ